MQLKCSHFFQRIHELKNAFSAKLLSELHIRTNRSFRVLCVSLCV